MPRIELMGWDLRGSYTGILSPPSPIPKPDNIEHKCKYHQQQEQVHFYLHHTLQTMHKYIQTLIISLLINPGKMTKVQMKVKLTELTGL